MKSPPIKQSTVTVRLDEQLQQELDQLCRMVGRSRSEVVREALKRHVALSRFELLRRQVMPFAEARGYLTDEDVANDVS